ncbi:MAG: methyltransferase domain-containing protein [Actinomycetota bacterium]
MSHTTSQTPPSVVTASTSPSVAGDTGRQDLTYQAEIRAFVREAYRAIPAGAGREVVRRWYATDDVDELPDEAITWALGVGSPVGHAELRDGEVVLDVGCGGGLDSLLAARQVGPSGRVIGLDLLPEMCERASRVAQRAGVAERCRFEPGEMEAVPLDDDSVDVVISNGALNLSARKSRTFAELARVLRPEGRLCASDLVVEEGALPPEVLASDAAWAGCIAGALSPRVLRRKLERAGFVDVELTSQGGFTVADAAAYPLFTDELLAVMRDRLPDGEDHQLAQRVLITARLPAPDAADTAATAAGAHAEHTGPLVHTGVCSLDDIAPEQAKAPGVTVRQLKRVDDVELKVMDVAAGGATPYHTHDHAHEGVIVQGRGALRLADGDAPLRPGDTFWVNPTEPHAIAAAPDVALRLVCMDCLV